jgi:hypothetical protein
MQQLMNSGAEVPIDEMPLRARIQDSQVSVTTTPVVLTKRQLGTMISTHDAWWEIPQNGHQQRCGKSTSRQLEVRITPRP